MVKKLATCLLLPKPNKYAQCTTRTCRTVLLISTVLFLHIVAIYLLIKQDVPSPKEVIVTDIKLLPTKTIQAIQNPPTNTAIPTKKEVSKAKSQAARSNTHSPAKQETTTTLNTIAATSTTTLEQTTASPSTVEKDSVISNTPSTASPDTLSTENAQSTQTSEGEKFSVPPAAMMTYTAYVNGVRNRDSTIRWFTQDDRYELLVEIPLPFIGKISYHSTGVIDQYGLAPIRYEETSGKRAPVASNFNRDARQTISFSKVTTILPLVNGAQDYFSVLWQLVSLSRGNPANNTLGATRIFYVVSKDQGEEWKIQALEEESIELEQGWVSARHFLRLPRYPDDQRRLEVWLAESHGWIPIKLRQTEPNGVVLELLFKKSTPLSK